MRIYKNKKITEVQVLENKKERSFKQEITNQ
jgi:hypothetical protein